jgi:hypothetical protein
MLEGSQREHRRAAERSLIIECTIAIELSADFDSPNKKITVADDGTVIKDNKE